MSRVGRIVVIWACCALALPTVALASSPQDVLASYDWSAKANPSVAAKPPPKDVVAAFIAGGAYRQPGQGPYELCAFTFADLRHTSNLSLVASVQSLRTPCNVALIVDRDSSQFEVWDVGIPTSDTVSDVRSRIKDLAGDGNLELVGIKDLTWYMGGMGPCVATWPVIFAWTGAGYTNVSDRFPYFYEDKLKVLNEQIADLPPSSDVPPGRDDRGDGECLKAEAAKIQRLLGISADAELSQAVALADSSDPEYRVFALALLEDIGTPEAIGHIKTLADESEADNAIPAQSILARAQQQPGYQNAPPQPERSKSVPFRSTSTRP